MGPLLAAVSVLAPVEWAREGTSPHIAPFLVWRFAAGRTEEESAVIEVVNSFIGELRWIGYRGRRNCVIDTLDRHEFILDGWTNDAVAANAHARARPLVVEAAHRDVARLAERIRLCAGR
jgi:hypothetical protein